MISSVEGLVSNSVATLFHSLDINVQIVSTVLSSSECKGMKKKRVLLLIRSRILSVVPLKRKGRFSRGIAVF